MEIKIPFKTPTINHLYWHRGNMKIMTTEAKKLREEIKEIVISAMAHNYDLGKIRENTKLNVEVEIHENWITQKGKVARKDIANREKFLIDSVFKALDIDDKFIFEHKFIKFQDNKEYSIIKLGGIKMAEDETEEGEESKDEE